MYYILYPQFYGIIDFSLPSFMIQEEADVSCVCVKLIVNIESSINHATDACTAK